MNKIQIIDKNLHEIKQEILRDLGSGFKRIGKVSIGDQIRETRIRFRLFSDYEHYVNAIDEGDDAEDAVFIGYI